MATQNLCAYGKIAMYFQQGVLPGDDVVETLQTVRPRVDDGPIGRQVLEPHGRRVLRDGGHVVEAPHAHDPDARVSELVQHQVDVGVVHLEGEPVNVGSDDVLRLAIDGEARAVSAGESGGRCGAGLRRRDR